MNKQIPDISGTLYIRYLLLKKQTIKKIMLITISSLYVASAFTSILIGMGLTIEGIIIGIGVFIGSSLGVAQKLFIPQKKKDSKNIRKANIYK